MSTRKYPSYKIIYLIITILFLSTNIKGQKFLVLDRYHKKRIKLSIGNQFFFKQKENTILYDDYILILKDTSLILGNTRYELSLGDISTVYFRRKNIAARCDMRYGLSYLGVGFLISGLVNPLVSNAQYEAHEAFIIGGSLLTLVQISRFFRWKKFKINSRSRIRIIDTTFKTYR